MGEASRAKETEIDAADVIAVEVDEPSEIEGDRELSATELRGAVEALIFVAEEPISAKSIAEVLKVDIASVAETIQDLNRDFAKRIGGLQLREIACGWQIATRPEFHEHVRAYLKS